MDRLQLYLEFMLWAQLHISTVHPNTGTLGPAYRIIWRENAFLNVTGQLSEQCSQVTFSLVNKVKMTYRHGVYKF